MAAVRLESGFRLHGRAIFLSASVPTIERRDEYERIPEAPIQIEEAVMCVARAIFIEGGTLVFGAHPSISPFLARVIQHYYVPPPAEATGKDRSRSTDDTDWKNPRLLMYQSNVWKDYWAESSQRLTEHPLVSVAWTEASPGESIDLHVKDRPLAPQSIKLMRYRMIKETAPIAMVAIGGMQGVLDEAKLFGELRPERPIFTFKTTGGAAAVLAKRRRDNQQQIDVIDSDAEELVQKFWSQQEQVHDLSRKEFNDFSDFYVPYAVVAQEMIAKLTDRKGLT